MIGILLLATTLAATGVLLRWLLIRNGRLLLHIEELQRPDGVAPSSRQTAPSPRLFGHLGWRNQFELDNVVAPIVVGDEYGLGDERFDPSDVIIDVGAHIGVFASVCHQRGSRAIHCYEADATNFERLERNVGSLPGVHRVHAAVWRSDAGTDDDRELLLSGADGDNTGACSILADGRLVDFATQTVVDRAQTAQPVRTVPLDALLSAHERVRLLKLDCEGSEFPILLTSRELHRVERIVGEVHELTEGVMDQLGTASLVPGSAVYRIETLTTRLETQGFDVQTRPTSPHLFIFSARRRDASKPGRGRGAALDRYVISMRDAGLGDRIICLAAAWVFARNTGRTLVADWRNSVYSEELGHNLFGQCFEPDSQLAGVPFIGDDRVARLRPPRPRYPVAWNDDGRLAAPYFRARSSTSGEHHAAVEMIRAGADVPAQTVIFDTCVNDGLVSLEDSRTFLAALRPVTGIAEKVSHFRRVALGTGPVIGLHIRHGNGAETGHAPYWRDFDTAIERCVRATRKAQEILGRNAAVLLCTDSAAVEAAVRSSLPDVVTRSKMFLQPGAGELHAPKIAHLGRDDAMVEMLLLAQCDALIRFPPGSFFSFYAAVMGPWKNASAETVYDLQRPHDPNDRWSPVLLY